MIPRACRYLRTRVGISMAGRAAVTRRTRCIVAAPCTQAPAVNQHRELGTTATSVAGGEGAAKGAEEKGEGDIINDVNAGVSYVLPAPTWSLSDLNVATGDDEARESAMALLTAEEVKKLCALAHIELAPDGSGSGDGDGGSGKLDIAAVQRDVGAMLRCMQTMRRERTREEAGSSGGGGGGKHISPSGQKREGEDGDEEAGPWAGAAPWAAPLQKDVVSDGGIQAKVLGSAQRTEDGFFTAPRVVEK